MGTNLAELQELYFGSHVAERLIPHIPEGESVVMVGGFPENLIDRILHERSCKVTRIAMSIVQQQSDIRSMLEGGATEGEVAEFLPLDLESEWEGLGETRFSVVVLGIGLDAISPDLLYEQLVRRVSDDFVLIVANPTWYAAASMFLSAMMASQADDQRLKESMAALPSRSAILGMLESRGVAVRAMHTLSGSLLEGYGYGMVPDEVLEYLGRAEGSQASHFVFEAEKVGERMSFLLAERERQHADHIRAIQERFEEKREQGRSVEHELRGLLQRAQEELCRRDAELSGMKELIAQRDELCSRYEGELQQLQADLERSQQLKVWYEKKFKEGLLSLYASRDKEKSYEAAEVALAEERSACHQQAHDACHARDVAAGERDLLRREYDLLAERFNKLHNDYNQLGAEITRLRKYAPDRLPSLLRVPMKASITAIADGPREIARTLKRKRRERIRQMERFPHVEVVTLSYNSERFLPDYFESFKALNYPLEKITLNIIDNASKDNSLEVVRGYAENPDYPIHIRVTASAVNTGFSGGNNIVLKQLLKKRDFRFALLLNVDTKISPDCISELMSFMREDATTGMVEAVQEPLEHPKWYDPYTFETGWCSGGGVLIAAEALREVGIFDHRFFLYCEDVDLSWRMWMKGWRCKINPKAHYEHFTESLDKVKDRSVQRYYSLRNSFFMHYKYDTWEGIEAHKKLFFSALEAEPPEGRELMLKAYKDMRRFIPGLLISRLRLSTLPKVPWVVFNGFSYEKRREFVDTEDGKRIIFSANGS